MTTRNAAWLRYGPRGGPARRAGRCGRLKARTADARHLCTQHRTVLGRILPRLVTDARIAARTAEGQH